MHNSSKKPINFDMHEITGNKKFVAQTSRAASSKGYSESSSDDKPIKKPRLASSSDELPLLPRPKVLPEQCWDVPDPDIRGWMKRQKAEDDDMPPQLYDEVMRPSPTKISKTRLNKDIVFVDPSNPPQQLRPIFQEAGKGVQFDSHCQWVSEIKASNNAHLRREKLFKESPKVHAQVQVQHVAEQAEIVDTDSEDDVPLSNLLPDEDDQPLTKLYSITKCDEIEDVSVPDGK